MPLLAGAGGKVLLSLLPDAEIEGILSENRLKKFTPFSCVNKKAYMDMIKKARQQKFAFDDEEYMEGLRAFAAPLHLHQENLRACIWVVGSTSQIREEALPFFRSMMRGVVRRIETRLSPQ